VGAADAFCDRNALMSDKSSSSSIALQQLREGGRSFVHLDNGTNGQSERDKRLSVLRHIKWKRVACPCGRVFIPRLLRRLSARR
jgi:hypothetical protein